MKIHVSLTMLSALLLISSSRVFSADNKLVNGGFEDSVSINTPADAEFRSVGSWKLGDNLLYPEGWGLHHIYVGELSLVQENVHSGLFAAKITNGCVFSAFPATEGSKFIATFWARGNGRLNIMLFQSEVDADGALLQSLPTTELESIELKNEWKEYAIEIEAEASEVNSIALAFRAEEIVWLDDVVVTDQAPK